MINKLNNILKSIYNYSGYVASGFLVFVAIFILTGIISRIFGFYIRGLAEYSGYCMAASSFFALAYTFYDNAHIRITLFLEKLEGKKRKFIELWCLSVGSFFSGFMAFYFIKMTIVSIKFKERSEGADEIFIWIPQISLPLGSLIFFICVFHHLVFSIINKRIN